MLNILFVFFFTYRTCVDTCPSIGYYVTSDFQCEQCHSSCATCKGPELSQCLTCSAKFNQMIDKDACVEHCPDSYHFGINKAFF